MALTKIGKEGITGISNSSDATFLTVSSSEDTTISGSGILTLQNTTANDTQKTAIIKLDHYHNSEEDFLAFRLNSVDDNIVDNDETMTCITNDIKVFH